MRLLDVMIRKTPVIHQKTIWQRLFLFFEEVKYRRSPMYKAMLEGIKLGEEERRNSPKIKIYKDIAEGAFLSKGLLVGDFRLSWNTTQNEYYSHFSNGEDRIKSVDMFGIELNVSVGFGKEMLRPHFGENIVSKIFLLSRNFEKKEIAEAHERVAQGLIGELGEPSRIRGFKEWYLTPDFTSRLWIKNGYILTHSIHHDKGDRPLEAIIIKREYSEASGYSYTEDTIWS